jgi:putative oxidoreductase
MSSKTIARLRTVLRIGLGVLLLWAAISKIARPVDFQASIYAYELPLPRSFLKVLAVFLPWTELLCGLMLLANFATETALFYVTFLFGVFLVATAEAAIRRLPISCGCFDINIFGIGQKYPGLVTFLESPTFAFLRNIFLTAAAVFLLRHRLEELRRGASVSARATSASTSSIAQSVRPPADSPMISNAQRLSRKQRKRLTATRS